MKNSSSLERINVFHVCRWQANFSLVQACGNTQKHSRLEVLNISAIARTKISIEAVPENSRTIRQLDNVRQGSDKNFPASVLKSVFGTAALCLLRNWRPAWKQVAQKRLLYSGLNKRNGRDKWVGDFLPQKTRALFCSLARRQSCQELATELMPTCPKCCTGRGPWHALSGRGTWWAPERQCARNAWKHHKQPFPF